VSNHEDTER